MTSNNQDLAHLRPIEHNDEIDLGELIRNLIAQWPLIIGITFLGAILGVVTALMSPKVYRVEAVFSKPSTIQLESLLAQDLVPLTRQTILAEYLKNLKSNDLIEQALEVNDLFTTEGGEELSLEERQTVIRQTSSAISIKPATYDFIEQFDDVPVEFDEISFSYLSSKRNETEKWMNSLLRVAETATIANIAQDIQGQQKVEISKIKSQLAEMTAAAEAERAYRISELQQALAVAKTLGIEEPTSWDAVIHGNGNITQLLTENSKDPDLFLQGTRFIEAQIAVLQNTPATPFDLTMKKDTTDSDAMQEVSAVELSGRLKKLEAFAINTAEASIIDDSVQAIAPNTAEKPNRKLIAVAATVLAGFLGLFIALIRIAIAPKD